MAEPIKPAASKAKASLGQAGLIILLILAIGTGIWLNRTAWRHRRLIWQMQAAVIAGGGGFVAGRLTAGKGSDDYPRRTRPSETEQAPGSHLHRDDERGPSADR